MPSQPHLPRPRQLPGRPAANRLINRLDELSPYWEPQLVVAAAILLDLALPARLTVHPTWLLPAVEGLLWLALVVASPLPNLKHSPQRRFLALLLIALVSGVNLYSLVELIRYLLAGH